MNIPSKARKILREKLNRRFWTQTRLAQEAGLSEAIISRALNSGRAHPDNFMLICKALRIRPETLMPTSEGATPHG